MPAGRISAKTLRYIVSKRAPKDPKLLSTQTGVSVSHIYRIRACHKETGRPPGPQKGRQARRPADPEIAQTVLAAHDDDPVGVARLAKRLHLAKQKISYRDVSGIVGCRTRGEIRGKVAPAEAGQVPAPVLERHVACGLA